MGIMEKFLIMGNAGFCPSTVSPALLKTIAGPFRVEALVLLK